MAAAVTLICSLYFQPSALLICCGAILNPVITNAVSATSMATATPNNGEADDRVALLAFKSKISDDPQGAMRTWNDSIHFCEWEGITCGRRHKRRVTALNLSSSALVGSISPHIGNLSFLRSIDLRNNTLHGHIPQELGCLFRLQVLRLTNNSFAGEIPANLSHSNLTYLLLGGNKLTGKIPAVLASLSFLKALDISYNNLVGGIPQFFSNLTALQAISLAYNALGGSIPNSLARLEHLRFLGLAGNNLSGEIPPCLYNLSSITHFSLSENQLHGRVSPNLGLSFPLLQILQLSVNFFVGPFPVSLSNASELTNIEMGSNKFSGLLSVNFGSMQNLNKVYLDNNILGGGGAGDLSFLDSLANCSNLLRLAIGSNRFNGHLPASIANFSTQMDILIMASNKIFGAIPPGIGNLINLNALYLHDNQITGAVPADLCKIQKLQLMSLGMNRLSGNIPSCLGNLSSLADLYLEDNKLQGNIPSSLGKCPNLLFLDLSRNNLSGTIPKQIFGISFMLISLSLAQNKLVGSMPMEVGNLKKLEILVVSQNMLHGQIPSSLGECTSLEYLYMDGNFFQGSIPSSLSSSRGIRKLDLSLNKFSGTIPQFLGTLSLEYLNLSFNGFEGEVPTKGVFANVSAISVVGNNMLCGGIDKLQLPKCPVMNSKKGKKHLVYIITIIPIACTIIAVTILSFSLLYWLKKNKKGQPSSTPFLMKLVPQVSYRKLHKATDGFSTANLIGVGAFGCVYKGILNQDEPLVAVKVLNLQHRGAFKSFMAECKVLRNVRHRNLVKIITSCSTVDFQGNDFKALVYEFMPNGSLERWLHSTVETNYGQNRIQKLNLLQRVNIAIDVACALDYLHHYYQKTIIHCDLKPSNVLLDNDLIAHVGDFGLAKFEPNPNRSSSVGVNGTIGYAAPEYGMGSEASPKGDVYSYGILLLEMITGKRPVDNMFEEGLNIHNFASSALPSWVKEIVDPFLLNGGEAEVDIDNGRTSRRGRNGDTTKACLISMVKIGVGCSVELPQDRMDVRDVIHELRMVRNALLGTKD
ncbi:probable LRR receptor-like serine/threonine-protein kinase At3g47570 [Malania oleifera]|uniref:probable LRR receptor-like serine/threonine-protein kinase At3g47570 n=1 Tax=Malania oleifera TaxID=397392 RepID=UPI0025ADE309|nr:probable LRR receptor-like serine/threonine-protein kinase At3g47570 [Malania oleifera]